MISGIIKVEVVSVISRSRDNRDIDYSGYHKTESNNCFIIHCLTKDNYKRTVVKAN